MVDPLYDRMVDPPAGYNNCLLSVPAHRLAHYLSMHSNILRCQLWQLIGLSVDPAQRLHLLEVLVVRQHGWEMDVLVGTPLGDQYHTPDFLYLGVIGWGHTVQITRYLQIVCIIGYHILYIIGECDNCVLLPTKHYITVIVYTTVTFIKVFHVLGR